MENDNVFAHRVSTQAFSDKKPMGSSDKQMVMDDMEKIVVNKHKALLPFLQRYGILNASKPI